MTKIDERTCDNLKCPTCSTVMQRREGKFGPFMFCPNQYQCGQKTITVQQKPVYNEDTHYHEPSEFALEAEMRRDSLYSLAAGMEAELGGMASVAYQNDRDHEHTRDRGSVDPWDVVFGGGMFCDMGMEDDDEDIRPW